MGEQERRGGEGGGGGGEAAAANTSGMQRVKVYRLTDGGKWDDRGTGHVNIDFLEDSKELGLTVLDEEDNETLLMHNITSEDIYRKQEDTIISWRDPEVATELALSFQEAAGCSYIWDNICDIQRNIQFNNLGALEVGPRPTSVSLEASRVLHSNGFIADESFRSVNGELRELPPVELSNLPLILKTILEGGITDQMRVAELITQDREFFPKLLDIFRICEDLENLDDLHMIFKLVRGIILLNSSSIFDKIFSDEFILDIIGALEYDPDVPKVQKHRAFLKDHVVFKEDVILPRVLDDGTLASLNTMIHSNNAAVISLLKDDSCFIQELFARMRLSNISMESKRELVLFLHEFCTLSKSLPLVQQLRLFRDLSGEGVFDIISDVLQSQDRKIVSAGTDVLILFLNQDPNLLRSYIVQQEGNSLLGLLSSTAHHSNHKLSISYSFFQVKGMVTDFGEAMHCQFLEILRILMDSFTMSGAHRDAVIEIFYEKHLDYLVDVIASSCPPRNISRASNSAGNTETEVNRTKPEILLNVPLSNQQCNRENPCLDSTEGEDDFLIRHVVKMNLFKPIIDAFVENGDRYNMLQSGVLELLEYIRKEGLKQLIIYANESFWDQLMKFEHFGSIQAFRLKYQQYLESAETKLSANVPDIRKKAEERGLEKEEEDYFNEDSDEEDSVRRTKHAQKQDGGAKLTNGSEADDVSSRPKSGGLVDYADDDDEDFNPPPKEPDRPEEDDEPLTIAKLKRKLMNSKVDGKQSDGEFHKRQKIETRITSVKIGASTNLVSKRMDDLEKQEPRSPASSSSGSEANGVFGEHSVHSEEHQRSADNTEASRQAGGDCVNAMGNLSTEKSVNTTNTNDSEPYSVLA
uniref:Serine/threonine-protein phosphatase 4 regulatory subunit 3-like central domain-containing protein n=1 Tax=Oryza rufipogon TaxID=4529 RepID=A0A0E0MVS8_ORYRU